MQHELHPCDVGVGLGSHDLGVAVIAVRLFHRGMFPRIVFTGANAPTTVERFPRGEAVHYGEYATEKGVQVIRLLGEHELTSAELTGGKIVGQLPLGSGTPEQFGAVLDKGSALTSCVSDAVTALSSAGTLKALEAEWLASAGSAPELK